MSTITTKGFKIREPGDYYDLDGIENFNTQKANDLVEEIDSKMMPGTNSTNNQLANRDFVNSSISHMAATPKGNWANWNSVPSNPNDYPADSDGKKKPSNNDYMVVQDMTGYINPEEPSRVYEGTWRFTYIGEWDDEISQGVIRGKSGWKPVYQVNEKPLTQDQMDALNSGINSTKVRNYDSHITNNNNPHQITKAQLGLDQVDNTSDANKPISNQQQLEFDKKVNINQGSQNEGKFLGINEEGLVVPKEVQSGGATPEQLATKLDKTKDIKKIEVVEQLPNVIDLYTMYMVVEEEKEWPGLKLTSNQNGSKVGYTITGTIDKDIYTSTDGKTWASWDGTYITLNQGESIYVWNKLKTLSKDYYNYMYFRSSGNISASGNINSMIDFDELTSYCYYQLFWDATSITTAPDLPATTLAVGCYIRMFATCDLLTTAPDLPATTLAESCYAGMFAACTSLTTAPNLPATTLADKCYEYMFQLCTSLTIAPDLPATTLANRCYANMFKECTSLTIAPDLPATTLANNCYASMFEGCTSLESIKLYYNGNFYNENNSFISWVYNVNANGTLYYNGSDTTRGDSAIPQNWAVSNF